MLKICGIYKIISPSNRIYIGQGTSIDNRWRDYKSYNTKTKNQTKLWRSFVKYGVENHIFEIVEECPIEELNCRERYWQDFYDVLNEGLNCILQECGEKRREFSNDTRKKISLWNMGRKPSKEQRLKTSIRMLGNTYSNGRIKSEEEKTKISNKIKLISQGKDNNMFGKYGKDNPNSKIILNIYTGIFYFGIKDAATANSIPISSLKKMICGNRKNITNLVYV